MSLSRPRPLSLLVLGTLLSLFACPAPSPPEELRAAWSITPDELDPLVHRSSYATWELGPPEEVASLAAIQGPRQTLLEQSDSEHVRVLVRVEASDARLPIPDRPPEFDSEDPIALHSARLREGVTSRRALAEAILRWQRTNLRSAWAPEDALDPGRVLRSRRAECLGQAALAAALLRAQGVEAQVAVGLALRGDVLVHHAWVEYDDGRTVTLDPTWGLHPAPATHLRLLYLPHDASGVLQQEAAVSQEAAVRALQVRALRAALE